MSASDQTRRRLDELTKPQGSLGALEDLLCQMAATRNAKLTRRLRGAAVVVAADHGIAQEGVSAFPRDVTRQMVANFLRGGAAASVLCRRLGIPLRVLDAGIAGAAIDGVERLADGPSRNIVIEPAFNLSEAEALVAAGRAIAERIADDGVEVLAVGEMGIGNTTVAATLVSMLLGLPPERTCGRGTGIDDPTLKRKVEAVKAALARHGAQREPLSVLASLGGGDIAVMTGLLLGAAQRGVVPVLDGYVVGAAALVASALSPGIEQRFVAAHRSAEPGHRLVLEYLGLEPLLVLGLRLGEASGALLALDLIDAATHLLTEMASFAEATVSTKL